MRSRPKPSVLAYANLEDRKLLATIIVDTSVDSDGSISDGRISLREAIVAANTNTAFGDAPAGNGADEIQFRSHLAGKTFNLQHGELPVTDSLSIEGDISINARRLSRVFRVETPGLVNLKNLTITGGLTPENDGLFGGGILGVGESNLKLSGVTFHENTATRAGGAISVRQGNLVVEDSSFTANAARQNIFGIGGAIHKLDGRLIVSGSTFAENLGARGGAIYHENGSRAVASSEFRNNGVSLRDARGGAIFSINGHTNISDSTFVSNKAGLGGAIEQFEGTLAVFDRSFTENSARLRGSAIYADTAHLFVARSEFANHDRLAITLVDSSTGWIGDSTFTDNEIFAVRLLQNSSLRLARSEFFGNQGAIQASGGDLTINQSTFGSLENPNLGRTIINSGANLNVFNSSFIGNSGSETISNNGATVRIRNTEFSNNRSIDGGAAIYNYGLDGDIDIRGSRFHANVAKSEKGQGGAIRSTSGSIAISDSSFTANQSRLGGAIAVVGGELNLFRVSFGDKDDTSLGNVAGAFSESSQKVIHNDESAARFDGEGGALFIGISADVRVARTRFFDNIAHSEGGAIAIETVAFYEGQRPNVFITTDTVFTGNRVFADLFATEQKGLQRGGAIFNRGGELIVRDSFFADNRSEGNGGAVFSSESGTTILLSMAFNRNESESSGGAIATEGTLTLIGSRVANNTALVDGGLSQNDEAETFISETTFVGNTP